MQVSGLLLLLLSLSIFMTDVGSALKFGFSPSEIYLSSSQKCGDISVFSNEAIRIDLEERWSEKESKDLRDYINLGDSFLAHNSYIEFKGNSSFQVCLYKNETFSPYGLLLLHVSNSSFSGGVWIKLGTAAEKQVKKRVFEADSSSVITGFASKISAENVAENNPLLIVVLGEFAFLQALILSLFSVQLWHKKSPS